MKKILLTLILTFTLFGDSKPMQENNTKKAYFAGGCFWGVEYHFEKLPGVIEANSGYMGGNTPNPTYQTISTGTTGHVEAVEVIYNPKKISFEELAKLFFEIHDPTQANGQGPDIGSQYLSYIFYNNENEKNISQNLIDILESKNYKVATKLSPITTFYIAEEYHQNYYKVKRQKPYCHVYKKRF
ncbi:MAG: Peptide methionine sulfoxide reductase MsrA [uncultured Campylobacterales bacterium]|uniref:Peptide methionine sulfoxide reductase MsrA n=1 Tax=uncultured Campylobacterales bacterium TaxID=352960 RepID=A0A6S6T169_9BACT|nr:MAG: Peptide methionine sulfoxide reductase MsrA [uncultured Campylobacterales bacterium]